MGALGLRGERIRLVPPDRHDHLDNAWRWMNDPDVTSTLLRCFGVTRGQEAEWFDRIEKDFGREAFVWAILTETGTSGLRACTRSTGRIGARSAGR
ncbi:MAG: hypothetical protein QN163_00080 [Armatimonadota bacterium]|nr:hypothetical protein [Armatimonadota bacterium]MDR5696792.1 hypothetical protein [Armatimonadota bacterium]